MFRYETHLHTAEGSACASASGAEQSRQGVIKPLAMTGSSSPITFSTETVLSPTLTVGRTE